MTFEEWCKSTDHEKYISLWDERNSIKPNEVNYQSKKKVLIKCERGLHPSRLIKIESLYNAKKEICKECNSIAQWGIDHYGEDFFTSMWGESNRLNPWQIDRSSKTQIYINCNKKTEHGEYLISCNRFTSAFPNTGCYRCKVCGKNGKPAYTDSLGVKCIDAIKLWSVRNSKTPYEYTPYSHRKVFWKCDNGIHEDYERAVSETVRYDFRCPVCSAMSKTSMLEEKVSKYLESFGYHVLHEYQCTLLPPSLKQYNNQKLPFDNQVVELNLIVEVNGKQHYVCNSWHRLTAQRNGTTPEYEFEQQQNRDLYKKSYAIQHGFFYLEIPYTAEKNDMYKKLIDNQINKILHSESVTITA